MEKFDGEAMLKGQAEIWKYMFNFVDSIALRCVVELRIPDIINSHGCPITLNQIASGIESPSPPDISCLAPILMLLVRKKIFTATPQSDGGDLLYGITPSSMWLLHGAELSLAPMLLMQTHPWMMSAWHQLSACIKEGAISAFKMTHGFDLWDFASGNSEFNRIFNDGMGCTAKIVSEAIVSGYKDGFGGIRSLVDVGGGTGKLVAEIVKAYPHIKGINFDLPHVVATAPEYNGVAHVGGDMFETVPNADAILMKWIMHDWSDEDCVKILKNCRKAVPDKIGKVIIAEVILQPDGEGLFDNTGLVFNLLMMTHTSGGKERTETEWKKLLEDGGFPRYKIIRIPAVLSIIEAYQE